MSKSRFNERLNEAKELVNTHLEKALSQFELIISDPTITPFQRVIALQHRSKFKEEKKEDYEGGLKDIEEAIKEAEKIQDIKKKEYSKEFLTIHKLTGLTNAMLVAEDQKQQKFYKRKVLEFVMEISNEATDLIRAKIPNAKILLTDILNGSIPPNSIKIKDYCPDTTFPLHFLLQATQDSFDLARELPALIWDLEGEGGQFALRIYRKQFLEIMMNERFFNEKPKLDRADLDLLKDVIINIIPWIKDIKFRSRVLIHSLCENTLLGHFFHSSTGPKNTSLGAGRLQQMAKFLMAIKEEIQIDDKMRIILDKSNLQTVLWRFFPDLQAKLYPLGFRSKLTDTVCRYHDLTLRGDLPLTSKGYLIDLSKSISLDGETKEEDRYIPNRVL